MLEAKLFYLELKMQHKIDHIDVLIQNEHSILTNKYEHYINYGGLMLIIAFAIGYTAFIIHFNSKKCSKSLFEIAV